MAYNYLISQSDIEAYKTISANVDFTKRIQPFIKEAQDFDLKDLLGYPLFSDLLTQFGTENFTITYTNLAVSTFSATHILNADNAATGKIVSMDAVNKTLVIAGSNNLWPASLHVTDATNGATADIVSIAWGKYYNLIKGASYIDPWGFAISFVGLSAAISYWTFARFIQKQQFTITSHGFVSKTDPYSTPASSKTVSEWITQARSGALAYWKDAEKYIYDMNQLNNPQIYDLWTKTRMYQGKKAGGIRISSINRFDDQNARYISGRNNQGMGCMCGIGYPCDSYLANGYCN